jgi:hypothetical protein
VPHESVHSLHRPPDVPLVSTLPLMEAEYRQAIIDDGIFLSRWARDEWREHPSEDLAETVGLFLDLEGTSPSQLEEFKKLLPNHTRVLERHRPQLLALLQQRIPIQTA